MKEWNSINSSFYGECSSIRNKTKTNLFSCYNLKSSWKELWVGTYKWPNKNYTEDYKYPPEKHINYNTKKYYDFYKELLNVVKTNRYKAYFLTERQRSSIYQWCINYFKNWLTYKNSKLSPHYLELKRVEEQRMFQDIINKNNDLLNKQWYHLVLKNFKSDNDVFDIYLQYSKINDAKKNILHKRMVFLRHFERWKIKKLEGFNVFDGGLMEYEFWYEGRDIHIHLLWYLKDWFSLFQDMELFIDSFTGNEELIITNESLNKQWNNALWWENKWYVFMKKVSTNDLFYVFDYIKKVEELSVMERVNMYLLLRGKRCREWFWGLRKLRTLS